MTYTVLHKTQIFAYTSTSIINYLVIVIIGSFNSHPPICRVKILHTSI